jgi:hypothetical protein
MGKGPIRMCARGERNSPPARERDSCPSAILIRRKYTAPVKEKKKKKRGTSGTGEPGHARKAIKPRGRRTSSLQRLGASSVESWIERWTRSWDAKDGVDARAPR